jgi:hypothetical protein
MDSVAGGNYRRIATKVAIGVVGASVLAVRIVAAPSAAGSGLPHRWNRGAVLVFAFSIDPSSHALLEVAHPEHNLIP